MRRRTFVGVSASSVLGLAVSTRTRSIVPQREFRAPQELITLRDPRVIALAHTALDASRSAGAAYADVRLTYTTERGLEGDRPDRIAVRLGMSVRALVNGYWGWAATPYLSESDAPRVGQEATRLASAAAGRGRPRTVDWGTIPVVRDGTWTTPIQIDPFAVDIEQLTDWMIAESDYITDLVRFRVGQEGGDNSFRLDFFKQERMLLSTEGSSLMQTVYRIGGSGGGVGFPTAQAGWEYIINPLARERIRVELDRLAHTPPRHLPIISTLDVGRYDIVFSANAMAQLLNATLAPATQVDRALGYEANADGTSYLGPDPLAYLGNQVAAPLITITADRSSPTSLATIGWDDDGVVPEDFTLIKDGVLVDYQTTREQSSWLAGWYQKQGRPIRSHGCAASADALTYSMQHIPNLTLHAGTEALALDDLIAGVEHGLYVENIEIDMDFQCLNGSGWIGGRSRGLFYVIRHGKLVAQSDMSSGHELTMEIRFQAPELWKNVLAIGGPTSVVTHLEGNSTKGEPRQSNDYSIAAVPAVIKQQAVIDPFKKA